MTRRVICINFEPLLLLAAEKKSSVIHVAEAFLRNIRELKPHNPSDPAPILINFSLRQDLLSDQTKSKRHNTPSIFTTLGEVGLYLEPNQDTFFSLT